SARSVVIMPIWPSWVRAIGNANFAVSVISACQVSRPGGSAEANVVAGGEFMVRQNRECRGKRKALLQVRFSFAERLRNVPTGPRPATCVDVAGFSGGLLPYSELCALPSSRLCG